MNNYQLPQNYNYISSTGNSNKSNFHQNFDDSISVPQNFNSNNFSMNPSQLINPTSSSRKAIKIEKRNLSFCLNYNHRSITHTEYPNAFQQIIPYNVFNTNSYTATHLITAAPSNGFLNDVNHQNYLKDNSKLGRYNSEKEKKFCESFIVVYDSYKTSSKLTYKKVLDHSFGCNGGRYDLIPRKPSYDKTTCCIYRPPNDFEIILDGSVNACDFKLKKPRELLDWIIERCKILKIKKPYCIGKIIKLPELRHFYEERCNFEINFEEVVYHYIYTVLKDHCSVNDIVDVAFLVSNENEIAMIKRQVSLMADLKLESVFEKFLIVSQKIKMTKKIDIIENDQSLYSNYYEIYQPGQINFKKLCPEKFIGNFIADNCKVVEWVPEINNSQIIKIKESSFTQATYIYMENKLRMEILKFRGSDFPSLHISIGNSYLDVPPNLQESNMFFIPDSAPTIKEFYKERQGAMLKHTVYVTKGIKVSALCQNIISNKTVPESFFKEMFVVHLAYKPAEELKAKNVICDSLSICNFDYEFHFKCNGDPDTKLVMKHPSNNFDLELNKDVKHKVKDVTIVKEILGWFLFNCKTLNILKPHFVNKIVKIPKLTYSYKEDVKNMSYKGNVDFLHCDDKSIYRNKVCDYIMTVISEYCQSLNLFDLAFQITDSLQIDYIKMQMAKLESKLRISKILKNIVIVSQNLKITDIVNEVEKNYLLYTNHFQLHGVGQIDFPKLYPNKNIGNILDPNFITLELLSCNRGPFGTKIVKKFHTFTDFTHYDNLIKTELGMSILPEVTKPTKPPNPPKILSSIEEYFVANNDFSAGPHTKRFKGQESYGTTSNYNSSEIDSHAQSIFSMSFSDLSIELISSSLHESSCPLFYQKQLLESLLSQFYENFFVIFILHGASKHIHFKRIFLDSFKLNSVKYKYGRKQKRGFRMLDRCLILEPYNFTLFPKHIKNKVHGRGNTQQVVRCVVEWMLSHCKSLVIKKPYVINKLVDIKYLAEEQSSDSNFSQSFLFQKSTENYSSRSESQQNCGTQKGNNIKEENENQDLENLQNLLSNESYIAYLQKIRSKVKRILHDYNTASTVSDLGFKTTNQHEIDIIIEEVNLFPGRLCIKKILEGTVVVAVADLKHIVSIVENYPEDFSYYYEVFQPGEISFHSFRCQHLPRIRTEMGDSDLNSEEVWRSEEACSDNDDYID